MFNWLGNLFPYSDLHSLNLDWILTKMKETAAQAAQAIADSAKALAQVAEAKAAALSAQTAAQNAQTAAQNAQTAANNAQTEATNAANSAENAVNVAQQAKSAAQTAQSAAERAQNTANTAQSAAQTAQNTANTAQSAAQTAQSAAETAQSAAETAQSAADTANTGVEALNAKFPVKRNDIAKEAINSSKIESRSINFDRLVSDKSIVYLDATSLSHMRFPDTGSATRAQISDGVTCKNNFFLNVSTEFFQVKIDILESGSNSNVFKCESYPVVTLNKSGTIAMLPFIIFNDNTNEAYDGFVKISKKTVSGNEQITCKVIFKTEPPFNDNTEFVINLYPLYAKLSKTP